MSKHTDDFFEGKRQWSLIKDQVLKNYMNPYITKVNKLGKPILLIDGYAGPGTFDDGSPGSPLIICQTAEKLAKGNWQAILINKDQEHHQKLKQLLQREKLLGPAKPLLGDSSILLRELSSTSFTLKDQTVFLYLDPFGPTGCEFTLLEPFLKRSKQFSTEIVLTMNAPGLHRFAARHAVEEGRWDEPTIKENHEKLSRIFGGDYWKEFLLYRGDDSEDEARKTQLIEAYRKKLSQYLPYTGFCPVREKTDKGIKYFIVFASRHPHAPLLLNDIMAKAYFAGMHKADFSQTLWEDTAWTDWREAQSLLDELTQTILDTVSRHPRKTRSFIWLRIIQSHFMRYLESEYIYTVQRLVDEQKLISPTKRPTRRLNPECTLLLGPNFG